MYITVHTVLNSTSSLLKLELTIKNIKNNNIYG